MAFFADYSSVSGVEAFAHRATGVDYRPGSNGAVSTNGERRIHVIRIRPKTMHPFTEYALRADVTIGAQSHILVNDGAMLYDAVLADLGTVINDGIGGHSYV
jgi:hypothetical protein